MSALPAVAAFVVRYACVPAGLFPVSWVSGSVPVVAFRKMCGVAVVLYQRTGDAHVRTLAMLLFKRRSACVCACARVCVLALVVARTG